MRIYKTTDLAVGDLVKCKLRSSVTYIGVVFYHAQDAIKIWYDDFDTCTYKCNRDLIDEELYKIQGL